MRSSLRRVLPITEVVDFAAWNSKRVFVRRPGKAEQTDQAEVISFLAGPATHAGVEQVDRFETHGNLVFLAGSEAWKIKRAVRFPYMDFSTLEKRRAACLREVEVNRRLAPEIYLGCVPITRRGDGTLALGGSGEFVEWAVHMRRFEQSALLSNIAASGGIDAELAKTVADIVHESHRQAKRAPSASRAARMSELVGSISKSLADSRVFDAEEVACFACLAKTQLDKAGPILDERARHGAVRRCHGDLHLGNIVLWRGHPVLYDAIEFDETIATIDILYDLAFLLMDLDWHGQGPAASMVFNRYLWRSHADLDLRGLQALPLFLGLRAGIRARVTADRANQEKDVTAERDRERARKYLCAARRYLTPCPPELIAIGGLSGTGKSTLGAALAPRIGSAPGAVHLRSDLERKALFAVEETARLPPEAYTSEATNTVYETLRKKARLVLGAGHSAIADAVHSTLAERSEIESIASELGVPFRGLWLTADRETLVARVDARRGDASDATSEIVEQQVAWDTGKLSPAWTTVDASGSADETRRHALFALGVDRPQAADWEDSGKAP